MVAFRHLLCEERKKRGLSQFELARQSGLTRQCISFFENGTRVPTFFSLFCLAKGLDMPIEGFMASLMAKVEYYESSKEMLLAADSTKPKWKTG